MHFCAMNAMLVEMTLEEIFKSLGPMPSKPVALEVSSNDKKL